MLLELSLYQDVLRTGKRVADRTKFLPLACVSHILMGRKIIIITRAGKITQSI